MNWTIFRWRSLSSRVSLFTLVIFLISLWTLAFYASRTLREDMQRLLGEQQFSTVSFVAAELNEELRDRFGLLERAAGRVTPALLGNRAALQAFLDDRLGLESQFNAGYTILSADGTAIADVPLSSGRIGINYMDRDHIAGALKEGKAAISRPVMGRVLPTPLFAMVVPIRDTRGQGQGQGKVIGALTGATDLGKPNFLDKIAHNTYGKAGRYLVVAPQYRMVITGTDKSRIMELLPASGVNPLLDRFIQGYEGTDLIVNPLGENVLASAKGVPVAGWYVAVGLPTAAAFAPIRAMQQRMLLAALLLTLLVGPVIWWMLRRQLAPMLAAVSTLASLSHSEQLPRPLPIAKQDEIGDLIGGFNRLLEILVHREEALKQSERKLSVILESVDACIYLKDTRGRYLYANRSVRELFGVSMEEIVGQSDEKFFAAETLVQMRHDDRLVLDKGETLRTEESNLNHDDGSSSVYMSVKLPLRNETGEIYALCGISTDISERKRAEEDLRHINAELERLSSTDALTGAWNRAHLDRVIETERSRSKRFSQPVSLILLDVDHFKRVNDTFGHQTGDSVLRELVQIVSARIRSADMLFRWGGEEFVVLATATGYRGMAVVAEALRSAVEQHSFAGVGSVTISLGAAEHLAAETTQTWFDRVDGALYLAKHGGRNRVSVDQRGSSDLWAMEKGAAVVSLTWLEAYECGEPVIDRGHRELFELGNALIAASIANQATPDSIRSALDHLLAHVVQHFAEEEALLARHDYQRLASHKQAHAGLLARAQELKAAAEAGSATLGDIVNFLANDVVARHLFMVDRDFYPLFRAATPVPQ